MDNYEDIYEAFAKKFSDLEEQPYIDTSHVRIFAPSLLRPRKPRNNDFIYCQRNVTLLKGGRGVGKSFELVNLLRLSKVTLNNSCLTYAIRRLNKN